MRTIPSIQPDGRPGGGGRRSSQDADLGGDEQDGNGREHLSRAAEDAELLHRPQPAEPERGEREPGHDGRRERRAPRVVARPARRVLGSEALAARRQERRVHVNAGVDPDADDDRGERDGHRVQACREKGGEPRRPERAQNERRQHGSERSRATERQHERERRQNQGQCAADREVSPQHLLGRDGGRLSARELGGYSWQGRGGLRALDVVDQHARFRRTRRRCRAAGRRRGARDRRRPRTLRHRPPKPPTSASSARHSHGTCARRSGSRATHVSASASSAGARRRARVSSSRRRIPSGVTTLGEVRARARPGIGPGQRRVGEGRKGRGAHEHTLDRAGVPERLGDGVGDAGDVLRRLAAHEDERRVTSAERARPADERSRVARSRKECREIARHMQPCRGEPCRGGRDREESQAHPGVRPSHLGGWGRHRVRRPGQPPRASSR